MTWAATAETYGFDLNNRELAALIFIGLAIVGLLTWKQTRGSALNVVRAFFAPKLVAAFAIMTAYTACTVAILASLHLWEWSNLKTTLVWWVTVGFAVLFQAEKTQSDRNHLHALLRETFALSGVIILISEAGSFSLVIEIFLFSAILFLGLLGTVAMRKPETTEVGNAVNWVIALLVLVMIVGGVRSIIDEPTEFFSWDTLREFGVPIALQLSHLPLIYLMAIYMAHESAFTTMKIWSQNPRMVGLTPRTALLNFGLDLDGTQRLIRHVRMHDVVDREGLKAAVHEIKEAKRREKNPPVVPAAEGWSPYEAGRFLEAHGIVTNDYHRSFDDWFAEAPSIKLSDRPLPDRMSFYITGNARAATRMRLVLDASFGNDTDAADAAFYAMSRTLMERVFGEARADELEVRLRSGDHAFDLDGKYVSIERSQWGVERQGGYNRNLVILHEAHPRDPLDILN